MRRTQGFTLIEVLITSALMAVLALAVYGLFDSGIRVMRKMVRPLPQEERSIFFEKFSRDLQNLFHYAGVAFKGEKERVVFATTVRTQKELGGDQGIGRVTYSYNSDARAIERLQENVSQIYEGKAAQSAAVLIPVDSLSFEYFGPDSSDKTKYLWSDEWDEAEENFTKGIPLAVRVTFTFQDEDQERQIKRAISIPVGG